MDRMTKLAYLDSEVCRELEKIAQLKQQVTEQVKNEVKNQVQKIMNSSDDDEENDEEFDPKKLIEGLEDEDLKEVSLLCLNELKKRELDEDLEDVEEELDKLASISQRLQKIASDLALSGDLESAHLIERAIGELNE